MTTYYSSVFTEKVNSVPVARQLNAIFDSIPDEELINILKASTGRPGYTVEVLWKTYITMYVLNLPSFAELIRTLQNNPFIAIACGITSQDGIPSKFAYSRFMAKLSDHKNVSKVKNVMRQLTRELYKTLPDFAKSVAIDSTDLKAWSNGSKKPPSDPDATWAAKPDTAGKIKFYFGYKLHCMVDTTYELPVAVSVTTANLHDVRVAPRVLGEARRTETKFYPEYVICDAGYSSHKFRSLIKRQYSSEPIIKINRAHKKYVFEESEEWKEIYNRRTSCERFFGRLKCHRKLNKITVQGIWKVTIHCYMPLIVVQAQALHHATHNQLPSIRQCVNIAT